MDWWMLCWLVSLALLLIAEGLTTGLVCIWFALGSLTALVSSLCHAPPWLQCLLFLGISTLSLILTRPLCKRFIEGRKQSLRSNADRNIGAVGKCTETICNAEGTGAVYVLGKEWTARSTNGETVAAGQEVMVEAISGVKLLVKPLDLTLDSQICELKEEQS